MDYHEELKAMADDVCGYCGEVCDGQPEDQRRRHDDGQCLNDLRQCLIDLREAGFNI